MGWAKCLRCYLSMPSGILILVGLNCLYSAALLSITPFWICSGVYLAWFWMLIPRSNSEEVLLWLSSRDFTPTSFSPEGRWSLLLVLVAHRLNTRRRSCWERVRWCFCYWYLSPSILEAVAWIMLSHSVFKSILTEDWSFVSPSGDMHSWGRWEA